MSSIIHEIGLEYAPIPEQAEAVFKVFQEIAGYLEANLGWNGKVFGRLDWYLNNFLGIAARQTAGSPLITAARNAHEYMTLRWSSPTRMRLHEPTSHRESHICRR